MTVRTNWFTMDNKIGVNLNKVVTSVTATASPSQPEYPGTPANIGDRVQGNGGSQWMFVQASATISAFNAIAIDHNGKAANLTSALVTAGIYTYGIAQFQIERVSVGAANGGVANAGDFFWALLLANHGAKVNVSVSGSVGNGVAFYVSPTTPGVLIASAVSSGRLNGMQQAAVVTAATFNGPQSEIVMFNYITPGVLVSALAISA